MRLSPLRIVSSVITASNKILTGICCWAKTCFDCYPFPVTLTLEHRALYASFDRFPTAKGAATRISHVAPTLFDAVGSGVLYVLGDSELPVYQREDPVEIVRFCRPIPNFLDRVLAYRERLDHLLDQLPRLDICHFRDPWAGIPMVQRAGHRSRTVYEINGLPSIELPQAYPGLPSRTLDKIRAEERFCWDRADALITPSHTLRANLIGLGVDASKIRVVPNGADLPTVQPARPPGAPRRYLLYFGALQDWQGVDVLLKAFALLRDFDPLDLVICSSIRERFSKPLRRLSRRLEIAERVHWLYRLPKPELVRWLSHACLTVAPLTECPRNLQQGCCPLKILESMAVGTPVVASDLPVTRELLDDEHGALVRPDRPSELARAIRILLEHPTEIEQLGVRSRQRIEHHYTWHTSLAPLRALYDELLAAPKHEPQGPSRDPAPFHVEPSP